MNCPKCTMEIRDDAKFCGSCGFTIQQPAIPASETVSQPQAPPAAGTAFNFDTDGRGQGRGYTWAIEHQGGFCFWR